jgi:hypothetical protein
MIKRLNINSTLVYMKQLSILFLLFSALVWLPQCSIKEQADELQALRNCKYEVVSADSLYIAGTEAKQLLTNGGLNLLEAPKVAFAYFQQRVPVKGLFNLRITNPGTEEAGINQFDYKLLIKNVELLNGSVNQQITVAPNGGTALVPILVDKDIYPLISNPANQGAVSRFFSSQVEDTVMITLKIRPGFMIADKLVQYPDYIDIQKQVTNIQIISYLKSL